MESFEGLSTTMGEEIFSKIAQTQQKSSATNSTSELRDLSATT